MARSDAFKPNATVILAVTSTSAAVTIPTSNPTLEIQNEGDVTAFIAWHPTAATATVPTGTAARTCYPILPGHAKTITVEEGHASIAAITASGSTTIYITTGEGL